jgi:uncharacterized cysteine cluster protein YcgN (CxxCxxCC family)
MKNKDTHLLCELYSSIIKNKQHEDKCLRCGECCKEKIIKGNKYLVTDKYCPAYDIKNKKCTIYNNRFYLARALYGVNCVSVEECIESKQHPDLCPYVPKDYKSKLIY